MKIGEKIKDKGERWNKGRKESNSVQRLTKESDRQRAKNNKRRGPGYQTMSPVTAAQWACVADRHYVTRIQSGWRELQLFSEALLFTTSEQCLLLLLAVEKEHMRQIRKTLVNLHYFIGKRFFHLRTQLKRLY